MTKTSIGLDPVAGSADFLELQQWAAVAPDTAALVSQGRPALTYFGLWDHISATSEALCSAGLRPGTVAALALPSDACFVTAALAVTLQSTCTPLDPGLTADECRTYLQRLGASTLIAPHGNASPAEEVALGLGMNVIRIRDAKDSPAGRFTIAEAQTPGREPAARHSDAAFILLTSSTTGVPKMVPWSRANVRAAVLQDIRAFGLNRQDRFLALMPFHTAHSIYTILTQLSCGGSVGCPSALDAAGIFAAFESLRPTWSSAGPALHNLLLAQARDNPAFFRQIPLRFVRSAGAPPKQDLLATLENLLGVPVLDSYGLTEIPGVARNTPAQRRQGSVGKSVGADIGIVDELGNLLPAGEPGEIVARGPTLTAGYLDHLEANQAGFRNGWFYTGDLGHLDSDGFLFLAGRKKEIINRGGSKISPREVDDALARHPAVADVAAFAVPHRTLGEDVAAAVVLNASAEATELQLRRFAAEHLAPYKVPRRIVFVESIPRTAAGKPKRAALSEGFQALLSRPPGSPDSAGSRRPPTSLEGRLIEIWRPILGIQDIGAEDNFFDLGGDSLSAARMLAEVEAVEIGASLDGSAFFDQPTIVELARIIEDQAVRTVRDHDRDIRILEAEGDRNPFFCFSSDAGNPYQFRHLSRELGREQPLIVVCPTRAVQGAQLLNAKEIGRQSAATIRRLRKNGPYLIGGYCYGGVVAFEAALQLVEQGEEVALLVLLDTITPGYPKILPQWRRYVRQASAILRGVASGKASIRAQDILSHLGALGRIVGRRLGAKAKRALMPPGRMPASRRDTQPEEAWNAVVMREYVPRAFPSRIVQFLASDSSVSTVVLEDPRLGWRDFAGGGFHTRCVPGDHVSILGEANAPELAAELNRTLQEAAALRNSRAAQNG